MANAERRYALNKRLNAYVLRDWALVTFWHTRQIGIAADLLPATFPALTKLWYPPALALEASELTAGLRWFTAVDDVNGWDADALTSFGLTPTEAAAAVAAAA